MFKVYSTQMLSLYTLCKTLTVKPIQWTVVNCNSNELNIYHDNIS